MKKKYKMLLGQALACPSDSFTHNASMQNTTPFRSLSRSARFLLGGLAAIILLASCTPQAAPTPDMNAALTQAFGTALANMQPAATLRPTETAVPPATAVRTPPALPSTFVAAELNPVDTPHAYIQDSCQYLHDKWNSSNSAPGTVAMVVMFHGIIKGEVEKDNQISQADFRKVMDDLHEMGFQAINTQQLADFLYSNAKIPERSVLLVVDDRHTAQNFNDHFRQYWEQWGWPVVNGWISAFGGQDQFLQENVDLSKEGWVDYQSHGYVHNINMTDSSTDEFLTQELQGSMANIQQYFNKTPIAIIWPGGNFGRRPVEFARKYGYKLGFTINPRGPIMYNWVPQADQIDPGRPAYLAEGPAGDPLMTLPRYWDTDVRAHLDEVRNIGKEAAAYAEQNKATELEYYDIMCAPKMGPIP
ncbi:MAG: polysaccharide deacetylase family protein [Bacteroidota bacterium]